MSKILKIPDEIKPSLNPYYTGSTLWVSGATIEVEAEVKVLILIILEVLYERLTFWNNVSNKRVLILIILEVLYELLKTSLGKKTESLNPYYTGSTLWVLWFVYC